MAAMENFGNPSSTHRFGRQARILVEQARKDIAQELNCLPGEIFFTSGGTEADNLALFSAVHDLGVRHIITSPMEHHAVLHPILAMEKHEGIKVSHIKFNKQGQFDLTHLAELLSFSKEKTLVSLMHGNNETGNLLPLDEVSKHCRAHGVLFHSDTVQTIAHYKIDLKETPVDFLACSAHKFHGPKGVGFLYVRGGIKVKARLLGGSQERNMRAGTENTVGIAGLHAAFLHYCENREAYSRKILGLKQQLLEGLYPLTGMGINGMGDNLENSLYTVVNFRMPKTAKTEMLIFQLDMKGFAVSGGSACNSGSNKGSHVLEALLGEEAQNAVGLRVSLSHFNTEEEISAFVGALRGLL